MNAMKDEYLDLPIASPFKFDNFGRMIERHDDFFQ